ncbi:hypothetical protein LZ554_008485 [Drepanopeziza brunnea f. sp. 'monogermtubi']|nr:hypothetical protein LZ554_008485 [Drepanopeziza brunnea f. sp. 'monogermtubi']
MSLFEPLPLQQLSPAVSLLFASNRNTAPPPPPLNTLKISAAASLASTSTGLSLSLSLPQRLEPLPTLHPQLPSQSRTRPVWIQPSSPSLAITRCRFLYGARDLPRLRRQAEERAERPTHLAGSERRDGVVEREEVLNQRQRLSCSVKSAATGKSGGPVSNSDMRHPKAQISSAGAKGLLLLLLLPSGRMTSGARKWIVLGFVANISLSGGELA